MESNTSSQSKETAKARENFLNSDDRSSTIACDRFVPDSSRDELTCFQGINHYYENNASQPLFAISLSNESLTNKCFHDLSNATKVKDDDIFSLSVALSRQFHSEPNLRTEINESDVDLRKLLCTNISSCPVLDDNLMNYETQCTAVSRTLHKVVRRGATFPLTNISGSHWKEPVSAERPNDLDLTNNESASAVSPLLGLTQKASNNLATGNEMIFPLFGCIQMLVFLSIKSHDCINNVKL